MNTREIKFRVWSIVDKKWTDLYPMFESTDRKGYMTYLGKCGGAYLISDCIIQQYTGLKDINGNEIYEGDLLKVKCQYFDYDIEDWIREGQEVIGHIWYANPSSNIAEWVVSFNHLYSESSCNIDNIYDVEVIGNILEHPEILK